MSKKVSHAHGDCCNQPAMRESRRGFLTLATLSAGVALLIPALPHSGQASGGAEILLLTCMDYRLTHEIVDYMDARGLKHKYDHIILAGASLGVLVEGKADWSHEFWDHVQVAKDLHHIKKVMVLDHRDCGAYKVFLGQDYAADRGRETEAHAKQLRMLGKMVNEKHPDLGLELLLMGLDGKVETISAA